MRHLTQLYLRYLEHDDPTDRTATSVNLDGGGKGCRGEPAQHSSQPVGVAREYTSLRQTESSSMAGRGSVTEKTAAGSVKPVGRSDTLSQLSHPPVALSSNLTVTS